MREETLLDCRTHVSGWLWCSLWFHLECLAFCRVGILCGPLELWRTQVVRGIRPPRHARTARVLEAGTQWHGCNCSRKEIEFFQIKRAAWWLPLRALTTPELPRGLWSPSDQKWEARGSSIQLRCTVLACSWERRNPSESHPYAAC